MAKLYSHKRRGWQVRYRVYFPDGSSLVKYRYASGHADAVLIFGRCEYLEAGSRAGNLQARESWRRQDLELSLRKACQMSEHTPFPISMGFWSQFETNFREQSSKLSGDKIMGIALVLDVDPSLLYVMSRGLPARYLLKKNRDALFI